MHVHVTPECVLTLVAVSDGPHLSIPVSMLTSHRGMVELVVLPCEQGERDHRTDDNHRRRRRNRVNFEKAFYATHTVLSGIPLPPHIQGCEVMLRIQVVHHTPKIF